MPLRETSRHLVVLVTGARKGFGFALVSHLIGDANLLSEHQLDLWVTSRDGDSLPELVIELESICVRSKLRASVKGCCADLSDSTDIRNLCQKFSQSVTPTTSVLMIACAGQHERTVTFDDSNSSWRYSCPSDFSEEERRKLQMVNVDCPVTLFESLTQLSVTSATFVFISSQAAEKMWWEKGNSLYGRQKDEVEQILKNQVRNHSQVELFCLRFPFIESDMAHQMYEELSQVERLPPKDQLFAPVSLVAQRSVHFIFGSSTQSQFFQESSPHIYSYQPR